jgi:chromosome segregation ATPase
VQGMKNFLQNLLIFFSLCLCGLIAFQWVRETGLRKDLQTRTDELHNKMEAIQGLESNLRQDEAEIKRLDGLRSQLVDTVKTNQIEIASLKKDLDKTTRELDTNIKQVEVYKDAIERANENITKQNEEIKKQNEEMKKIADDRNEMVKKFNKTAQDFNDLVGKWNKQQEDLAKQATNAPAKK